MIYIVIWEDRHSDVGIYPFSTKELAIDWARAQAAEMLPMCIPDEDVAGELTASMIKAGWLYFCRYSCEGDCISVRECELDVGDAND